MKTCLIVTNPSKLESQKLGEEIAAYLAARQVGVTFYTYDGRAGASPFTPMIDAVITLGGDGTVLFAARSCAVAGIPVFPVNLGDFGFIASIEKNEWRRPLDELLAGTAVYGERSMVFAEAYRGGELCYSGIALNDVLVRAANAVSLISLQVTFNETPLGVFRADGIIVSTATGSTAYSASAGGPIIDPDLDALILTPVNAFSLSSRPVVLNPDGELRVTVLDSRGTGIVIASDGQNPMPLYAGDVVKIMRAPYRVKLAGCTSKKFYTALRSKLNWSGGSHARNAFDS